jgi:hypothetical protein
VTGGPTSIVASAGGGILKLDRSNQFDATYISCKDMHYFSNMF